MIFILIYENKNTSTLRVLSTLHTHTANLNGNVALSPRIITRPWTVVVPVPVLCPDRDSHRSNNMHTHIWKTPNMVTRSLIANNLESFPVSEVKGRGTRPGRPPSIPATDSESRGTRLMDPNRLGKSPVSARGTIHMVDTWSDIIHMVDTWSDIDALSYDRICYHLCQETTESAVISCAARTSVGRCAQLRVSVCFIFSAPRERVSGPERLPTKESPPPLQPPPPPLSPSPPVHSLESLPPRLLRPAALGCDSRGGGFGRDGPLGLIAQAGARWRHALAPTTPAALAHLQVDAVQLLGERWVGPV